MEMEMDFTKIDIVALSGELQRMEHSSMDASIGEDDWDALHGDGSQLTLDFPAMRFESLDFLPG